MSLDSYAEPVESETDESDDSYTFDCNWHISLDGYWDEVDPKYFGANTPNEPPLMAVPEKLAADMEIIQSDDIIQQLSNWIYNDDASIYTEVLKITFNDFSTWHIPLRPWDKDYARTRANSVKRYMPQIIEWNAIIQGNNPEQALEQFDPPWESNNPEWFDDFQHYEMDEETRKWYNENVDWLAHIDKTIKSDNENIDIDEGENDDWTKDW